MAYSLVTNYIILTEFKKCRYFKTNLGLASTVDKGNGRVLNERDRFAYFYNSIYKTSLLGQGNIGDVKIYVDHYINEPVVAVYAGDNEEFIFEFDQTIIKEKGIDFYIGHLLKQTEIQHEERVKEMANKKIEPKKIGNSDLITLNPGSVSYDDLKAYLEMQNAQRYKGNS